MDCIVVEYLGSTGPRFPMSFAAPPRTLPAEPALTQAS